MCTSPPALSNRRDRSPAQRVGFVTSFHRFIFGSLWLGVELLPSPQFIFWKTWARKSELVASDSMAVATYD